MNRDEMKGEMKDTMGRMRRQAGEWTDDKEDQVKGVAKQAEGKGQKVVGDVKEKGSRLKEDIRNMGRDVGNKINRGERTDQDLRKDERRDEKEKAA